MKQINDLRCSGSFQEPRPLNIVAYVVLSKAPIPISKPLVLEAVSSMVANKEALQILARREYVRSLSETGVNDALTVSKGHNIINSKLIFLYHKYYYLCTNFS